MEERGPAMRLADSLVTGAAAAVSVGGAGLLVGGMIAVNGVEILLVILTLFFYNSVSYESDAQALVRAVTPTEAQFHVIRVERGRHELTFRVANTSNTEIHNARFACHYQVPRTDKWGESQSDDRVIRTHWSPTNFQPRSITTVTVAVEGTSVPDYALNRCTATYEGLNIGRALREAR